LNSILFPETFGVTIDSTVEHERLAWDAHCKGVHPSYGWVVERMEGRIVNVFPMVELYQ
jgi:hypothetical protein